MSDDDLKLDENLDLVPSDGLEALKRAIIKRLEEPPIDETIAKGKWFTDLDFGLPYHYLFGREGDAVSPEWEAHVKRWQESFRESVEREVADIRAKFPHLDFGPVELKIPPVPCDAVSIEIRYSHKIQMPTSAIASMSAIVGPDRRAATEAEWLEAQARESEHEYEMHPCNSWDQEQCDCAGACGCHWVPA